MAASADSSEKPWSFSPPPHPQHCPDLGCNGQMVILHCPQMWAVGEGKDLGQGFPGQLRLSCRGYPCACHTLPAGPSLKEHLPGQPATWVEKIFQPRKIF
ncbi:unnamed protein product [Rangifer tarandus platyrhynchus]|uniref:Uncharacterized protein n=1 Tax=Rangifer tarandus platyrhynchus TaxID=3082113 RepID=A0AC59ZZU3_RANTA